MSDRFSEGNNFYEIREKTILFWGFDIKKPFEVNIDDKIKKHIDKNSLTKYDVYEINEDVDFDLYKYSLTLISDVDENDKRVLLMNKLVLLGIKEENARLIAIEAGASQVYVNRKYLDDFGINKDTMNSVLSTICDFYLRK